LGGAEQKRRIDHLLGIRLQQGSAAALALTRAPVQMAESHNVANDAVRSTPAAP
jgi:hypothetical protein